MMKMKTLLAMFAAMALFAQAQQPPVESQTKVTTETQTKVTVKVEEVLPPPPPPMPPRTVTLIAQNHCPNGAEFPILSLTDALTAKLSGHGFQVINPYNAMGTDMNRTAAGEKMPRMSAFDLAQELNADGAVTASVIDFIKNPLGYPPRGYQFSIRITLNLADAKTGATICGETISDKSRILTKAQADTQKEQIISDLFYSVAERCAQQLEESARKMHWEPAKSPAGTGIGLGASGAPRVRRWGPLTMEDIDGTFNALVNDMIASPLFIKNYDSRKSEMDRLPVIVLGGLKDMSNLNIGDILSAASDNIRIQLFKTRLFDVKDDTIAASLADRIVASGKSVIEDGELVQALKQHGSPDFYVLGDIRLFADYAERRTYRLHLALHDLNTGKVIWEDIKTIVKARD